VKKCIIIHGGPLTGIPEYPHSLHKLYWQPCVKDKLEKQGFSCSVPAMPNPWHPLYTDWKVELEKHNINEETVLVGHSRGVAFLVRWLGETKQQVKKLIMVAPNLRTESENPILRNFYSFDIDP
jgi:predicted alpha/beta hydrolase family esterase